MRRHDGHARWPLAATILAVSAGLLGACQLAATTSAPTSGSLVSQPPRGDGPATATVEARVVDVVDGDTIRVEIGGATYRLRYIGINAAEVGDAFASEATTANGALVGGQLVQLERDVSETDRYGRLLRYVWIVRDGSWLLVNRELVRLGWARSRAYPPDTRYQAWLDAAEREARRRNAGMWAVVSVQEAPVSAVLP